MNVWTEATPLTAFSSGTEVGATPRQPRIRTAKLVALRYDAQQLLLLISLVFLCTSVSTTHDNYYL